MTTLRPGVHRWIARFLQWLYAPGAWAYEAVAAGVSWGCWRRWVRHVAHAIPIGSRVLELGYGPGHLQVTLAHQGRLVYGADASLPMARRATRRLRQRGHIPRLVVARAQALPFPNGAFDALVATFPTPYIVAPETVREAARVLRPRGRIYLLLTAEHPMLTLAKRVLGWLGGAPNLAQQDTAAALRAWLQPWDADFAFEVQPWPLPCRARGWLAQGNKKDKRG